MSTCMIDGKPAEIRQGDNLVETAKRVGIEIPVFCYHPGLSVVAQCRMCVVEIEKMPKLQTACSMTPREGMVVSTRSEKVLEGRKSIMEFLLINHPLDCPICDKAGECTLQDYSFEHGSEFQRMTEERRTYLDLDMGPVIQKNMNRCIHCSRCIRFGEEVAGIREMIALKRGNNTEITSLDGRPLETDYAGNYADICPTGSLTLRDFRFRKRVWMLKKTPTVCEGCSRGCNMEIQWDGGRIYRCLPRENMAINKYWLCDEGRFNYHYIHANDRIVSPQSRKGSAVEMVSWEEAVSGVHSVLRGKKTVVLVGSDLTQEELLSVLEFSNKELQEAEVFHFGTPDVRSSKDDLDTDKILKRRSKTSNLHGAESLGINGFEKLPQGTEALLILRGGRATVPDLGPHLGKIPQVGIGVFHAANAAPFSWILPGTAFVEKSGTVVNSQGMTQQFVRAIAAPSGCKPISEILMMWMHQRASVGAA